MSDEISEMISGAITGNVCSNLHRSEEVIRRKWCGLLSHEHADRANLVALEADIRVIVANEMEKKKEMEETVARIEKEWREKIRESFRRPPTFKQQATIFGGFVAFCAVLVALAQLTVYAGINF